VDSRHEETQGEAILEAVAAGLNSESQILDRKEQV
jgi:hypothetical protein